MDNTPSRGNNGDTEVFPVSVPLDIPRSSPVTEKRSLGSGSALFSRTPHSSRENLAAHQNQAPQETKNYNPILLQEPKRPDPGKAFW